MDRMILSRRGLSRAQVEALIDESGGSTTRAIEATFDGGGSALTTAVADPVVRVPVACTVTGWHVKGDPSGSAVVDVQRATAAAPATFASIAGTEKPTLSGATDASDASLTTWGDTGLDAGDWIRFVLDSATTVTHLYVVLIATEA